MSFVDFDIFALCSNWQVSKHFWWHSSSRYKLNVSVLFFAYANQQKTTLHWGRSRAGSTAGILRGNFVMLSVVILGGFINVRSWLWFTEIHTRHAAKNNLCGSSDYDWNTSFSYLSRILRRITFHHNPAASFVLLLAVLCWLSGAQQHRLRPITVGYLALFTGYGIDNNFNPTTAVHKPMGVEAENRTAPVLSTFLVLFWLSCISIKFIACSFFVRVTESYHYKFACCPPTMCCIVHCYDCVRTALSPATRFR